MSIRDLLDMAIRNLWKRKLRTFLTILGVVIGTTSIVVMISIGIGMNESFQRQLEGWGDLQVINVYPSSNNWGGEYMVSGGSVSVLSSSSSSSSPNSGQDALDNKMVEKFRDLEHVAAVTPVKNIYLMMGSGKYVADAQFVGIEPATMEEFGYKVEEGRALNAEDKKSIVVGGGVEFYNPKLSWEMRWRTDPPVVEILDSKVEVTYDWNYGTRYADKKIKPYKYEVVGLMSAEGMSSWTVVMPIDEVEKIEKEQKKWQEAQYGGRGSNNNASKEYEEVLVKVDNMDEVQNVQQQIKDLGFRASSLTDELEAMKETTKMLRLVLGAIGAISLVVAAIGITNTMVMSIYERTREIGIMKVIGASLKDIKRLFLVEAAFIGFGGGIVGAVVSLGMSKIINIVAMQQGSTMTSSIPLWLYMFAVAFATVIGVMSGYFPAQRAMRLSALAAIKTE